MIIGNSLLFAIESKITQAYEQLSYRALGFFLIYIKGHCYGVREDDATMLACSFDEISLRIAKRNKHTAVFAELEAKLIANAFRSALYADRQEQNYCGIPFSEFRRHFDRDEKDILWAPDGDAAFDDGSYVLQFDVRDRVRLIAFKSDQEYSYDPDTLSEVWMPSETFYQILQKWRDLFEAEWNNALGK